MSRPKIRMQIVADGENDPSVATPTGRWHAVALVEKLWTSDGRWFENIGVREEALARGGLPLMADDQNHEAHLEATLIGNADKFEKRGDELHLWGSYLSEPDERAAYLIHLVQTGELSGFSADVEATEFEILFPVMSDEEAAAFEQALESGEFPEGERTTEDGQDYEVVPGASLMPRQRVTEGQLMGGTALTFPAFEPTIIEHEGDLARVAAALMQMPGAPFGFFIRDELTAAAPTISRVAAREAAPARFTFPDIPPAEWFEVPETPGPMPLTILDSGQVFGHLAIWGECHIGITGECVEPPRSNCNYARFHVGETPVAPDGRVATGRLTFHCGHADTHLDANATRAHYDNSGTVAASLRAMDGEYGIWSCGAMRSHLTTAQVREIMECPPSGDWRRWGADLELVAALSVNVPGFNTPRERLRASGEKVIEVRPAVRVRKVDGLVSSLIVSHPAPPLHAGARDLHALGDSTLTRKVIQRIAASIGLSDKDRIARAMQRAGVS